MFLDENRVWPPREPPAAPRRTPPPTRRERVMIGVLLFDAVLAMLAPISLTSAVDLIRWLLGG